MPCTHVFIAVKLLLSFLLFQCATAGNILIFSHIGSHFHLMSILAEELCERGHSVTIVAPSFCFVKKDVRYNAIPFAVEKSELDESIQDIHNYRDKGSARPTLLPAIGRVVTKGLFQQSEFILKSLENMNFQMAVVDPAIVDALVLVAKLSLPHIIFTCSRFDVHLAKFSDVSLPISYVPVGRQHDGFTHQMSLLQRTVNFWRYFYQRGMIKRNRENVRLLRNQYIPEASTLDTNAALRNTTLWIVNSDFNIEFPYPVMPSVKYVGSLTAMPASGLPKQLDEFVGGWDEYGVVLFSLSTLLPLAGTDIADKFLKAFTSIPQRVIWRGETIHCDSDKILFTKWVPQNDVLGSPNTRVLITTGGLNGIQEAMYHGVPMIVLPMFGDQPDNAIRVEAHGYGVRLDPFNLTTESIVEALKLVLYNHSFRQKMQSLSEKIKFEQSRVSGREMAAYWVEHAMKYGHLYTPPAQNLSYIQCHGMDILLILILICVVIVLALYKMYQKLTRKCRRNGKLNRRRRGIRLFVANASDIHKSSRGMYSR